jgi:hypothetical protein
VIATTRKTLVPVALAVAALGVGLSTIGGGTPEHRRGVARPAEHRLRHALIANATPIWKGDRFRVVRGGTFHGGSGSLPPYLWSSAWEEGRGFLPHSNTDPNVMGVTMQPDPTGLARQVIKIRADEKQNSGAYTRMELRGPSLFSAGMTAWVTTEIYIPPGTPTMPTARDWWTTMEVYGPPYAGTGPMTIGLSRGRSGTGNDFVWRSASGEIRWRSPARAGVWFMIARKIHFARDSTGYVEIYESHRGAAGNPTGPLRIQRLANGRTRWDLATLDSSNAGGLNHPDLKNYHIANMWPGRVYTDLYYARPRVYGGHTPVAEIDPYYTGLR